MKVFFTQFLMPRGVPVPVAIDRPEPIARLAEQLSEQGCEFEIEMLQTGEVSMEVMRGDELLAGELCPNGPEVPLRVDRLIERAALALETKTENLACRHQYAWSRYCGARVCDLCGDHLGLARCFCGWARDGGDGRAQLEDRGETIDPDPESFAG